ncbi:hypothetical protein ACRV3Q_001694 [Enterobacter hormaechei]
MSVKRYQPAPFTERVLHASDDGEYVKHEDYAALEARCLELAAEVYDLKHPGTYLPSKCETPALDAFLAEVRAQGVEMAAKSDQFSTWVQQGLRSFAIGVRQGDEQ